MSILSLVLVVVLGCGPDEGPSVQPVGDPDFSDPNSLIQVQTSVQWGAVSLSGAFADGPPLSLQREAERSGDCRMMSFEASTCEPGCGADEACVDGSCEAYPSRVDRGPLVWSWASHSETLLPDGTLGYYGSGDMDSHGVVQIEVDGMVLSAASMPQVQPDGEWASLFEERPVGEDVVLQWTEPVEGARVRLRMTDCVGSHGGIAAAEIECDVPDEGQMVIPGAYVDLLVDGDWSRGECGDHIVQRYLGVMPTAEPTFHFETLSRRSFFWRAE